VGGLCSTHVEMRSVHNILVRKPEEMRPLGRLSVDTRIILEFWIAGVWTGFI
jgi:hypothetical protein